MASHLRPLSYFFPTVSRSTRYRWRKSGKIRKPDIVINGREFYDEERPLDPPADETSDVNGNANARSA